MALLTYAKPWIERIHDLLEEKPQKTTHQCCFSLTNRFLKLIHLNKTFDQLEIVDTANLAYDNIDSLHLILSGLLKKYALKDMPIHWLLSPNDYQIFLIDSMPVEREEFESALSWRLRNLIDYPINEAVLDSFIIPAGKTSSAKPMVAAVAARKNFIENVVGIFDNLDLEISHISIPELAMRNLAALQETNEKSTALIYFYNNIAILNISLKKELYFSRQINIPADETLDEGFFKQFSLDILRYFDYFQTNWRHPSPDRILLGSQNNNTDHLANMLSKSLMMPVDPYSFNHTFIEPIKEEKNFMLEIACMLNEGDLQ